MLAALERELEEEPFVVVGVHSPKFPNENDAAMVREAVRRYGVTHPVVVDTGRRIWDEWGVRAWPTLVVVDAEGQVVAAGSGEPDLEALRAAVRELLPSTRPAPLPLRPEPPEPGSLAYPAKVIAADGRVFVADTGHGQVVECDLDGGELRRLGGFHHPNGLAYVDGDLYVADTGSHTIKRARGDVVEAVAGTGDMSRGLTPGPGSARQVALRSPWDLAWDAEARRLYVAMAGAHQIWAFDPVAELVWPFAGTGHEVRRDGPANQASFAQPSGLALIGDSLYVADSEISSIRAVDDLHGEARVRLVCGSGELFGFGDRDGVGEEVRLQHPMGIAAGDGVLYVADSYNHKVKRVDPAAGECRALVGGLEQLPVTGEPGFWEPEGLAVVDGKLLVADTNNHRIVEVGLDGAGHRTFFGR